MTRYDGKGALLVMPIFAWIMYAGFTLVERFPQNCFLNDSFDKSGAVTELIDKILVKLKWYLYYCPQIYRIGTALTPSAMVKTLSHRHRTAPSPTFAPGILFRISKALTSPFLPGCYNMGGAGTRCLKCAKWTASDQR